MRFSSFFCCCVVSALLMVWASAPTRLVAEQTTSPAAVLAPEPAQQMREHLQAMDRRLRLRLLRIADQSPSDGLTTGVSEAEIQRFRRHLRLLEDRLNAWNHDQASTLIKKVHALRPLVDNLERAAQVSETAAAGLAGLRKALRVEWPTAPGLKAGVNDNCADAIPIGNGTYFGDTSGATPDGEGCYDGSPDVWFAYSSLVTGEVVADTFGSGFDTVLAVYTGCPGTYENQIACNDDLFGQQSAVSFLAQAGEQYLIRVTGSYGGNAGPFTLNVGPGGVISGTVSDAMTGEPVAGVELEVTSEDGYYFGIAVSGPDGAYDVPGLAGGTYFIHTQDAQGYLREVYDDLPCARSFFGCQPRDGTPVAVASGATTGGIDFALHRGGTVSGTVTEAATGDPISNIRVRLWDSTGQELDDYSYTSSEGHFSISGLWQGAYYAATENNLFRDELYDSIACPEGCDPTTGTAIEVSFNATTGGINFQLEELGIITGTVTESVTGFPITSGDIGVWDEAGALVTYAFVNDGGSYRIGGLDTGSYFVTTDSRDYFDELYNDLPCDPDCDPTSGHPVAVSLNSTTMGIDFALERLGAIAGSVIDRGTGESISGADIYVWNDLGDRVERTSVGSTGTYFAEGLVPGNYTVSVREFNYQGELYDDLPCPAGDCDPMSGTPVAVSLNTVTGGVDFALEELGSISGRVTHTLTGQPVEYVYVEVRSVEGDRLNSSETDSSGRYIVRGLPSGSHFVSARRDDYLGELYDDIPCPNGDCDLALGAPVTASLNTVTEDIDFALERMGSITGRVVLASTGQPVDGARVEIYDSTASYRRGSYTDSTGLYVAGGLLPGTYFAITDDRDFDDVLYDGILCPEGCDPTSGTPIAVSLNAISEGIDFEVRYCTPTATSLCLTGDRFRVEAVWENAQNVTGPGFAETLTADAGYFWFFDPGNIELVVKVLDVCIEPYNQFWVFGAGLTDVGVELTVTDELTGDVRSYTNPLGATYVPVLDTQAFPTCYAGFTAADGSLAARPLAGSDPVTVSSWQPLVQAVPGKAACTPTATSLCVNGRFLVEALWEAPNGDGGSAQAVPLTGESGYFWFGSVDNVEVVVKVLDACDLAPFHNYWVFAAGLTNFEITLRVTDTESGEIQEYLNPQGTSFQAVTDTGSFATCSN